MQFVPVISHSEITIDRSFQSTEIKALDGPVYEIEPEYGIQKQTNLFHSFKEFNIYAGDTANFIVTDTVKNVISRVTGGNVTTIDGTIRSTLRDSGDISQANLFFLNPAGIVFGANARLDIGGSFYVSTADYLLSEDMQAFSSKPPADTKTFYSTPLNSEILSSAPPKAFGFLDNSQFSSITFQGDAFEFNNWDKSPTGLSVPKNSTLSIVAGDIQVNGIYFYLAGTKFRRSTGNLTALEGTINMISIKSKGMIHIDKPNLIFTSFDKKGNISLFDHALIDVSSTESAGSGNIFLYGDEILINHSEIKSWTESEKLGGNIEILSRHLHANHGKISTQVINGRGGNIKINAWDDIIFSNKSSLDASVNISGQSGDIVIHSKNLSFLSGSYIKNESTENAIGGNVSIYADNNIYFSGTGSNINTSAYSSSKDDAGNVHIEAKQIMFSNEAEILAHINGTGNGGTVKLLAKEAVSFLNKSNIITVNFSEHINSGSSGHVSIISNAISIKNGAEISTITEGSAMGGNIIIDTGFIEIDNGSINSSSKSLKDSAGEAGNICIGKNITFNDDHFTMTESNSIKFINSSKITTEANNANGGNISIKSSQLYHMSNSRISTSVINGEENAGNINIYAKLGLFDSSKTIANAFEGNGGNVYLTGENLIQSTDSIIDASSQKGVDGIIKIDFPEKSIGNIIHIKQNMMKPYKVLNDPCKPSKGNDVIRVIQQQKDGIPTRPEDWLPGPILPLLNSKEIAAYSLTTIQLLNQAKTLFQKSKYNQAIPCWKELLSVVSPKDGLFLQLLEYLSTSYQGLGFYRKALAQLCLLLPEENCIEELCDINRHCYTPDMLYHQIDITELPDSFRKASFYSHISDLFLVFGNYQKADKYIHKSLSICRKVNNSCLSATVLNNYGNLLSIKHDYTLAEQMYRKSLTTIMGVKNTFELKSAILINQGRLFWKTDDIEMLNKSMENAKKNIQKISGYETKTMYKISLTHLCISAWKKYQKNGFLDRAYCLLDSTIDVTKKTDNKRIQSFVFGYMGHYYDLKKNYKEARFWTDQAIFFAQEGRVRDLLYYWEWQAGRILKSENSKQLSKKMYKNATINLNPVRIEFFMGFRDQYNVFDTYVKPVYMGYIDCLLEQASSDKKNLQSIIDTLEELKNFELQDYFRDKCATKIDARPQMNCPDNSAILYPVSLPDRFVLLIRTVDEINIIEQDIESQTVDLAVDYLKDALKLSSTIQIQNFSSVLYRWIVDPIKSMLTQKGIDTLIFVPDGSLRLIPFSVLHDGNEYIVNQYAIGIIPNFSLTYLEESSELKPDEIYISGLSEEVQGFTSIPYVLTEVSRIQELMQGTLSVNDHFTNNTFESSLKQNQYKLIHMATHAMFGINPETTFLLTYDSRLTINKFKHCLDYEKKGQYIDLLTLSACQTAYGNERSALGLAGMAIKSGVRTSVATLWFINDAATSIIMEEFYRQLKNGKCSKVKALQRAKKKLIEEQKYQHPKYWAAFILIGNWL